VRYGLYGLHRNDNAGRSELAARALRAEAVGFESLWVGDHIALPDDAPDPADEPRLEALTALTFLAAVTERVRLGAGVLVLPQRHPVLAAKQLASIDHLSIGRLEVGVAIGYVPAELAAFGVELSERAARTEENVAAIRALWAGERGFVGRWTQFGDVSQTPQPTQRPGPPIVFGGHAPEALRRAARLGDGWFGWELTPTQAAEYVTTLAGHREPHLPRLQISVVPQALPTPGMVDDYSAAGVDRLILCPDAVTGAATDRLIDHAADHLVAPLS